jgi:glycosyltransferase involved in cell wall biosynthesis
MQNCQEENIAPLFSVVIPVYQAERYLGECIDSVLNQTYENFEVVIVDDGSSDRSGKICDTYAGKDSRVVVIHKENGGPTSARTIGAEKGKGKYILFLDSDDRLDNETLKRMSGIICEITQMLFL